MNAVDFSQRAALNAGGQLLLKAGTKRIGKFIFRRKNSWPIGSGLATELHIISGFRIRRLFKSVQRFAS